MESLERRKMEDDQTPMLWESKANAAVIDNAVSQNAMK
jgi:hypothetical protein